MLRFIHLQYAAAYTARPLGRRDRNAFVALAFTVDVVVVGDNRATGQLEHRLAAASDPVTFVGVGPGDRALGVDLFGDLLELGSVLRGVPVEVVAVLLAIAVADDVVDAHGVSVIRMACSGQEWAASRTASSKSAAASSETADAWPSMSSSSKGSGAIIEHSVCPWQRSGSTRTFTTFSSWFSSRIMLGGYVFRPPLTPRIWPVIYPPSSDTRKAQAAAMSSGLPIRRTGVAAIVFSMSPRFPFSSALRNIGGSMKPGGTAVTVMPLGPYSSASDLVSPLTADLAAT